MSDTQAIVDFFVEDTLKMTGGVLLLVCAWKIYRFKCNSESDCGWFKFTGSNDGGNADVGGRLSEQV